MLSGPGYCMPKPLSLWTGSGSRRPPNSGKSSVLSAPDPRAEIPAITGNSTCRISLPVSDCARNVKLAVRLPVGSRISTVITAEGIDTPFVKPTPCQTKSATVPVESEEVVMVGRLELLSPYGGVPVAASKLRAHNA